MQLYLIRHAQAGDAPDDFARPLSSRGREQIASLVQFFRANAMLRPEEVWHSPLVRARETAEGLSAGLGWRAPFKVTDILEPDRDPQAVVRRLNAATGPLALVGHEPLLSSLGTLLIKGSAWPLAFSMGKGDVLALERASAGPNGPWMEKWHLGPELLSLG
jgi:phosphohistidine phosphatase